MVIALCEFVLFMLYLLQNNDKDQVMCISGLILAGVTAVASSLGMLFFFLKEKMSIRTAAVRALGKQGISAMKNDRSARIAYKGIVSMMEVLSICRY